MRDIQGTFPLQNVSFHAPESSQHLILLRFISSLIRQ